MAVEAFNLGTKPLRIFTQSSHPVPTFMASFDYDLEGNEVKEVRNPIDVSEDINRYIQAAAKVCYQGIISETDSFKMILMGPPEDVYIFCSHDGGPGWMTFVIMDSLGEVHTTHICSDISFAMGDLYLHRPKIQEILKNKFRQGYQVWLLPVGCVPPKAVVELSHRQDEIYDLTDELIRISESTS